MFDDEAYLGFIDAFNQFDAEQRNGYQYALDLHFDAFREYLDRRLVESEMKTEKRFAEIKVEIEKRFSEAAIKTENRLLDIKLEIDKRFGEIKADNEKRFNDLHSLIEVKTAQSQSTLIRWMFTFFAGTIITLATLFFTYLQLVFKQ
jgi:hypothetical protein